ncbi:anaphase-promoting complex subunit [Sarcoptes scabiei]|nr:anaphase-promoting complex subunit [Sarcoptes scabiei]
MVDAGIACGPTTLYGDALMKVGKHQICLGQAEKEFVQQSYRTIIIPLRKFLDEDMKTIAKERKVLETKRLDLDVAKKRLKKAKSQDGQANLKPEMIEREIEEAKRDLENCQIEFDRQLEITKLLLEGLNTVQSNHAQCLNNFANYQIEYYNRCQKLMVDLQQTLSQPIDQSRETSSQSNAIITSNVSTIVNDIKLFAKSSMDSETNRENFVEFQKRNARCLNDYKAQNIDELSLKADEIITVSFDKSATEADWMIGERSSGERGKVPVAYLEILN